MNLVNEDGWTVRPNPQIAKRAIVDGDWPNLTIADSALAQVESDPDRVQIVDGNLALTRLEVLDKAMRLAGWFDRAGLEPGDVISFQLPNWWEAAVVNLAAAMTGIVVNPIVPIYRDAEVAYMLKEAGTRVVFAPVTFRGFGYAEMMQRILQELGGDTKLVTVRGEFLKTLSFDELVNTPPLGAKRDVSPDAVKLLMYTSGTTGRPKGVLHSHNTLNADSIKMTAAMSLGPEDKTFSPSPVTHISGYLWALNAPWTCDLPVVMTDLWDTQHALSVIRTHECSFMLGATPFLQGLVAAARDQKEPLPSLRYFLCGGASVPPSLIEEAAALFPNCIPFRVFGATEVPTMTCGPASRSDLDLAANTDGKLHRCEVRIVDPVTGNPVPAGAEGEILAREPSMALGYARAEDNVEAYDEDGFFRTGDLGRLVHGDHLICTGRKKDLIIRSGENISAKEIEDVLVTSPKIEEVAVVSMPNTRTGEAICAFVVPVAEATLTLDEIAQLVAAARLAKQKTPEHLELLRELPKTASGKVRKDWLRKRAAELAAAQVSGAA